MTRVKLVHGLFLLLGLTALGLTRAHDSGPLPIRVVTENLAPYNMVEGGQITGLSTEIVKAVLNNVGVSPRIEVLPWARAYDLALHSDSVLIYSIARTPQREHLFKWVGAIAPTTWYLSRPLHGTYSVFPSAPSSSIRWRMQSVIKLLR